MVWLARRSNYCVRSILRVFRERFHYGRRAVVREMLEEWKNSGDISKNSDVEVLMDLIYGPVYMRLMIGHAPLDEAFAESHLNYICELLGSRS